LSFLILIFRLYLVFIVLAVKHLPFCHFISFFFH